MNPIFFVVFVLSNWTRAQLPFQVQFGQSAMGRNVTICIDGRQVKQTFAGKLNFQDERHSWQSVCADVRTPVRSGQVFTARVVNSLEYGGNIAKAGNIVAKYFKFAQTPDQCAGLQIAVWKALEDGSSQPDFGSGHFQVRASQTVIAYAQQYYQAINEPGQAAYIQNVPGPSTNVAFPAAQSQLSTN